MSLVPPPDADVERAPARDGARPERPQLEVVAEHALVGEAVARAMIEHGLSVRLVDWDDTEGADENEAPATVGLLLSDLETVDALLRARRHLALAPVHWIVLGSLPRGPAWGAIIEAGAAQVRRADTPLGQVVDLVRAAAGEAPLGPLPADEEHEELLRQWEVVRDAHEELLARLESLSPKEEYVLGRLHHGEVVTEIARDSGVSQATVRSQVKSMLRKLDVRSQLAAVAIYDWGQGGSESSSEPLWSTGPGGIPNFWESSGAGPRNPDPVDTVVPT